MLYIVQRKTYILLHMHNESSYGRRENSTRPPFRRRKNRHPGLAERETKPRQIPKPKGEIPAEFADTVFSKLHPLLQHAVADQEYMTPTPIQEKSIPYLLEGRDLMGCAQTGTGKTAAFLLPILHRLTVNPKEMVRNKPRVLILAPTRELAAQIATSTTTYGRYLGTPFAVVFGGVSQYPQVSALNRGAVLVVATPGRLLDLISQGHLSLDAIETFVLDEADRMLDMGFMPDIKRVLEMLPKERHTLFFSATFSPEVTRLALSMVKDPVTITISPEQPTVDRINQKVLFVEKANKDALLIDLLKTHLEMDKVLVFARTRHGSDKIERKLCKADIVACAIHSDKTQRARTDALNAFRAGRIRVLVATDIASRGIDVDAITHVINFDLPHEPESYVHRIGRTARAGADGVAFSFVSTEERNLLRAIERTIKKRIECDNTHSFHSERAERAMGKPSAESLARPPWARGKREGGGESAQGAGTGSGNGGGRRRGKEGDKPRSHAALGRRQDDFKKPHAAEGGRPPAKGNGRRQEANDSSERAPRDQERKPQFKKTGNIKKRSSRPPWMR